MTRVARGASVRLRIDGRIVLLLGVSAGASVAVSACVSGSDTSPPAIDAGFDGATGFDAAQPVDATGVEDAASTDSSPAGDDAADTSTPTDGATSADSATGTDAMTDAGDAATADAADGSTTDIVVLAGIDTGNNAIGASFASGAWTTASLGTDLYSFAGGGVTVTPGGRGLVVFRGNTNLTVQSALWTGSWGKLASEGTITNVVSVPYAAGTGAFLAYQGGEVGFAEYDEGDGGTWSPTQQDAGAGSNNNSVPAVVSTSAGDPMLLFPQNGAGATYGYALRTAGTWGAAGSIPGTTLPSVIGLPSVTAVRRAGTDTIVAALASGTSGALDVSVYVSGTWTTTTGVVTDMQVSSGGRSYSLAALPDGRVALAYVNASQVLKLAFYNGSAWGTFNTVPGAGNRYPRFPITIARGANGQAVVELVYLDGASDSRVPQHVRLTNEGSWTWSAPVSPTATALDSVYVAVGP